MPRVLCVHSSAPALVASRCGNARLRGLRALHSDCTPEFFLCWHREARRQWQSGQTLTSPRVSPDPPGITAAPLWRLETNACRKKPVSYPQSAPGGLPSTTPSGTSSVTSGSLSDCTQFVSIGRYGCIDEGHEDGLLEASAPHNFQSIFPGRLPSDPEPSSHPTVVQFISAPRLNLLPEDVRTWGKVPAIEAREKAVENLILPPLLRQNRSITCTRPSFVTGRVQMRNFEFGIDTEFQTAAEE